MPRKIKNEKVEEKVVPSAPVEKPATSAQVQKRVLSKAEQMKEHLDSQPKVSILIPLERGEKKGATQPFCINGYRFTVPKGAMTQVPEQVAQMISERFAVELDVRSRAIGQKDKDVKDALE